MKKLIFYLLLSLETINLYGQSVTISPKGNTLTQFSLSTTSDISQTGTPTISQLIYNTNPQITGANANGIGYYYWNGASWQSLDANIPSGTVVFSETHPNQALINSGFQFLTSTTTLVPSVAQWIGIGNVNSPLENINTNRDKAKFAFTFGNKFYLWFDKITNTSSLAKSGGIYDPETDTWTKIDTSNSPNSFYGQYIRLKDKIIYAEAGNLLKIYNPEINQWSNVSNVNSQNSFQFKYDEKSNYLFTWDGQNGKYFDATNNTWSNINLQNAPIKANFQGQIHVKMNSDKVFMWYESYINNDFNNPITEPFVFDLNNNSWSTVSQINQPKIKPENSTPNDQNFYFTAILGDTLLFKQHLGDGIFPDSINFKRYSLSQDMWLDDIPPYIVPTKYSTPLRFLTKVANGNLYFERPDLSGWGSQHIEIFKLKNGGWNNFVFETNGRGVDMFESKKIICGSKLIFTGGGISGFTPIFYDGFIVDLENEEIEYVPAPFNKLAYGNNCCSASYWLSYSGFVSSLSAGNIQYIPSGLMKLNNPQNNQTQKVLYLYKKN